MALLRFQSLWTAGYSCGGYVGRQEDWSGDSVDDRLNAHTISLAADGRRLAFASLEIESNAWSIPLPANPPATASGETQLTFGVQLVETADISSDGRWLFYDSDLGGQYGSVSHGASDGTPERLTTDPSDDFFPDISPDGREIAFHSWRGGSRDIYVLPLDGGPTSAGELVTPPGVHRVMVARRYSTHLRRFCRQGRHLDRQARRRGVAAARTSVGPWGVAPLVTRWKVPLLQQQPHPWLDLDDAGGLGTAASGGGLHWTPRGVQRSAAVEPGRPIDPDPQYQPGGGCHVLAGPLEWGSSSSAPHV